MTDTTDEPNWSLLPHNPMGFFGLSAGFDRLELKRSYNQLIRRFKPERFPQEFQRIRAAYEQLESAIRYGQNPESAGPQIESFEWLAQAASPVPTPKPSLSLPFSTLAPTLPLYQRIQSGSVSEIYRELKDRPDKTPYDFYALAVISDAVDRREGQQFVYWILQGLTAHRNEIGLSRLLHAYFSGLTESEHCESLLVACSNVVREDLFFPLTEPLWRLLLRTQKFSVFSTTLRQCEANLKGVNIDNRLAFYMQILKPAVWVADLEWINESYNFIEQNHDRIPSYLDYDLEILSRLRAYIEARPRFDRGDEICHRLDQAMRDYFCEEQLTGDQRVLACQVLMARDAEGLGAAFSDYGNPAYAAFFAVWIWVSHDVAERHVEPPKETLNENIWHPRTKTLLSQIERQTVGSRLGIKWATRRVVYRGAQAAGYFFCALLPCLLLVGVTEVVSAAGGNSRGGDTAIIGAVFVGVGLGVFFGFRLSKRISTRYWQPYTVRISADCYRRMWQREIVNFLARSHLPYQTLRAYIQSFPAKTTSSLWLKHYVDQDYALPMFTIAHRFVV